MPTKAEYEMIRVDLRSLHATHRDPLDTCPICRPLLEQYRAPIIEYLRANLRDPDYHEEA